MMNCPKCNQNIIGTKKVKDVENKWDISRGAAFISDEPIIQSMISFNEGMRLFDKYIRDEVVIKCPHCGAKITLNKEQYKELQSQIKENKKVERQNGIR